MQNKKSCKSCAYNTFKCRIYNLLESNHIEKNLYIDRKFITSRDFYCNYYKETTWEIK